MAPRFGSRGGIHAKNTSPSVDPPLLVRGGSHDITNRGGPEQDFMPSPHPARTPTPLAGATRTLRVTSHGNGGEISSMGSGRLTPLAPTLPSHLTWGAITVCSRAREPAMRSIATVNTATLRTR